MDKTAYLAAIDADVAPLVAAARQGLDAPVPSCPGWTAGHVVVHVGRAYRWIGEMVATRAQTPVMPTPNKHSFDRADPSLFTWFEQSYQGFRAALSEAPYDEPVWTWSSDHSAGFWLRVMSMETALHRYDAQLAHACAAPVAPEVARAAIDLTLDNFLPQWRRASMLPSRDESYHLHRTDGEGEWLLRFGEEGVAVSHEHTKAAVALRGTASDLLLFLWRRGSAAPLEVLGDAALVERFFELAPPA